MRSTQASLVVIFAAAVAAPFVSELLKRFSVPPVLFEILLGIVVGPQLLGWAEADDFVTGISTFGLAFLMFFAGYEVDMARVRGAPIRLAALGWVISLALGLLVIIPFVLEGLVVSDLLVGLALTTTAIGTLLPMMNDQGITHTRFGSYLLAAGSVGEFAPIVAITLLFSGDQPFHEGVLLVAFVLAAIGVAVLATRPQPPGLLEIMRRHLYTSSQLPVRIALALLAVMIWLAFELGLDTLLGAFVAGMILRLLLSRNRVEQLESKLAAVGYGVFIPVFFVVTGITFDLDALLDSPSALARVPVFLVLFLVVRGLPVFFVSRGVLDPLERRALALLTSTALPLVVVITTIGLETGRMHVENATALVSAAMLSVLVYPLLGFALARRSLSRSGES